MKDSEKLARDDRVAFRDRDEAWWDRHVAPEFVRHDPGLDFEVRGPQGLRKLAAFLHGAFSQAELPASASTSTSWTCSASPRVVWSSTGR